MLCPHCGKSIPRLELSTSEMQLVILIGQGLAINECASYLKTTRQVIKNKLGRIYRFLGFQNLTKTCGQTKLVVWWAKQEVKYRDCELFEIGVKTILEEKPIIRKRRVIL